MKCLQVLVFVVCVARIFAAPYEIRNIEIHDDCGHILNYNEVVQKDKIIIDTDGGVDDAMAILMALAEPGIEVLAITTVVGNSNLTQCNINVLKTLRVINSKLPVYAGAENSLIFTPQTDNFFGEDGFGDVPDPNPPSIEEIQSEHAVSALIRLVHQFPHEITIVALGPLTNLALAMRIDPTFKRTIKKIIWVGGSTEGLGNMSPGLEFNAFFDPAANFICFNEPGPLVTLSPWEVSYKKTEIPVEWRRHILGVIDSPQMKFMNQIEEKSLAAGYWSPIDSKTMAMFMNPSLILEKKAYYVDFVWEGDKTRGLTSVDYVNFTKKEPNAEVIINMDVDLYKEMLFKYLSGNANPALKKEPPVPVTVNIPTKESEKIKIEIETDRPKTERPKTEKPKKKKTMAKTIQQHFREIFHKINQASNSGISSSSLSSHSFRNNVSPHGSHTHSINANRID